jgi:hypothetical protein
VPDEHGTNHGSCPFRVACELPKEKAGCWTRRRAFAQVRWGSNIQLLPYPLVLYAYGRWVLVVQTGCRPLW